MFWMKTLALAAMGSEVVLAYTQHDRFHRSQARSMYKRTIVNDAMPAQDSYEYVVVGSGPGGAPVAARLALAGHSVLLIDSGDDENAKDPTVEVPALHPFASQYDPISWGFFTNHYTDMEQATRDSKFTYQLPNGTYWNRVGDSNTIKQGPPPEGAVPKGIWYPRTQALGGCAQHNALVTIYPSDSDWKYIEELTGDDSWAPEKMREYFKKMEKCRYLPADITGHGFDGWHETQVTPAILIAQDTKVLSLVTAAATTMGKGLLGKLINTVGGLAEVLTLDINSPARKDSTEGLYQVPLAMKTKDYSRGGPRDWLVDIATATNSDGSRKYNLDIQLNTHVTKVNFNKNTESGNPRAEGVDFIQGHDLYSAAPLYKKGSSGQKGSVKASKEVIVSGGTFNTPQILKLSGVGPKDELTKHGIDTIIDLPGVGTNMQDRYEVGVVGKSTSEFALLAKCTFLKPTPEDDPCYQQWKTAPPYLKGGYQTNGIALAYLKHSEAAAGGKEGPQDLYLGGVPAYFNGYFPDYANHATADLSIWTWLTLKAQSRNNMGTVSLTSSDPFDTPNITFNSFAKGGDEDLQAVYEGMKFGVESFKNLIPLDGSFDIIWPPANITESEEDLKQFARDEAWGHHASCSCPIGADDDPMAVLDSSFRVRGAESLRVVDASVFPKIPGTYIVTPIYMIAEKAAMVIQQQSGSS